MIKQVRVLHAIPNAIGWGNSPFPQVYDVTNLAHKDQERVKQELQTQGYFVQDWFPSDPVDVLVHAEIRERIEKEQTKP